jgi:hypothetical protein
MIHLVKHDKVGAGYALQESDGQWIVRFFYNFHKHFIFTKHAFRQGYLKDCGTVNIGATEWTRT